MLHTPRPKTIFRLKPARGSVRVASCKEIDCEKMKYGWKTILSYSNPKMISAMEWIRKGGTGRAFVEQQVGDGMVEFYFREGQSCLTNTMFKILYLTLGNETQMKQERFGILMEMHLLKIQITIYER